MPTVTIEEAQAKLPEIVAALGPGAGLTITRDGRPVAQLIGLPAGEARPIPGRGRGMLTIVAEDDEHLKDWAEYMP